MINVKIFSQGASNGAVALSEAVRNIGIKSTKVSFTNKEITLKNNDLLVNWGSSTYPKWIGRSKLTKARGFLNMPEYVGIAVDKIKTFKELAAVGVCIPEFALYHSDVSPEWKEVVGRSIIKGSGGKGIEIFNPKTGYPNGYPNKEYPLYVKYIKKTKEYRVHVFGGSIIDAQEKRQSTTFDGQIDFKIRSHDRGWVFCREEVSPPMEVYSSAIDAVDALNLDFGAVDIIWNRHYKKAYVLEVNTAPGLEGSTITSYATAIANYINNLED